MVWLDQMEHMGILALIALLQIGFTVAYTPDVLGARSAGIPVRIAQALTLLITGWIVYSVPWALLAFSMRFPFSMLLTPLFFVLGGFTVIGAITTKTPMVGGFIGGSVPLAALSLFYISSNPQMQEMAPPLAWFGLFMLFGGMLGALTGPATVKLAKGVAGYAARRQPKKTPSPLVTPDVQRFDAFLSHNSNDKATVRQLAAALQARGIRVWLDEDQLVPGRPWQQELEKIIQTSRTAVVLVGRDGLGPWEVPEMRACLSQFIKRDMAVIPVLLPGAPVRPPLPLFLQELTWVDLRNGLTDESMDRLEWGITGIKP